MKNEEWKIHDLAVVRNQPTMQPFLQFEGESPVQIEGLVVVITEIINDCATVAELQLSGHAQGVCGAIELSCLEKNGISGPMRAAYAVYRQNLLFNEPVENDNESRKRRRRLMKIIAENNTLVPKDLHRILKDLDSAGVIEYYGYRQ